MRLLLVALIPTLLAAVAAPARAADKAEARPKAATVPALEEADKRLAAIEKLMRSPVSTEPSSAELAESCRSSFTVTEMTVAIRGWMMQGSPLRGVLTGDGVFESFSKKTLGEAIPLIQQYQTCMAQATGKKVCEPMQLLGSVNASDKGGLQCGEPRQEQGDHDVKDGANPTAMRDNVDEDFVAAMTAGRKGPARGYCEQSLAEAPMFEKASLGPACDAIIAHFDSPAAACPRLKTLAKPSFAAQLDSRCAAWIGKQVGDAATCPSLTGDDKTKCEQLAALRKGTRKLPKRGAPQSAEAKDPTCERSVGKLRDWYCGRFTWPAFRKLSAATRNQAKGAAQAERANRRAKAIDDLKAVNDMLSQVVSSAQMGVLSAPEKERLAKLVERRDRVTHQLDDGRAPGPAQKKEHHGPKPFNKAGGEDSSGGDADGGE